MSDSTSITPSQAATMADAVYALRNTTVQQAMDEEGIDFTGKGAASQVSKKMKGTSGAFNYRPSSGFGYCAKNASGSDAFVILKGTSPCLADVLTDLDAIPTSTGFGNKAAGGFVKTFRSLETRVESYLRSGNYTTIHCIGHSLGGALATLFANKYAKSSQAHIKLYTFGSPRVFLGLGQQLSGIDSYRVYHEADPVPMLGPFPYMHHDNGFEIGSGMALCNPLKHTMKSYRKECHNRSWQSLRAPVKSVSGVMAQSKAFAEAGGSWMFRALQHIVTYGISVLALSAGGIALTAYTAVDVLLKLLAKGIEKLSSWITTLLRAMSKFIRNGWESSKAKASDAYYRTKNVMYYIIDQFLLKMRLLAQKAIDVTNAVVSNTGNTLKSLAPILGTSYAPMLPIFLL